LRKFKAKIGGFYRKLNPKGCGLMLSQGVFWTIFLLLSWLPSQNVNALHIPSGIMPGVLGRGVAPIFTHLRG